MALANLVDRIWRSEVPKRQAAEALVAELTDHDILEASTHVICAQHRLQPSSVRVQPQTFSITLDDGAQAVISMNEARDLIAALVFVDIGIVVYSNVGSRGEPEKIGASDVLIALQFARDRGDAGACLPSELREEFFQKAAENANITTSALRRMVANFPRVSRVLENG